MFAPGHSFLCVVAVWLVSLGVGAAWADEEKPAATHTALGSTPQEIGELYGKVLKHNARVRRHQILDGGKQGGTVIDGDLYSRNGLMVRVVFHAGVAVLLEYTRVEGPLTAQDTNLLLAASADASTWEQGKDNTDTNHYYRRTDGKAVAHYATEYDGSLLIAAEGPGADFYGGKLLEGGH